MGRTQFFGVVGHHEGYRKGAEPSLAGQVAGRDDLRAGHGLCCADRLGHARLANGRRGVDRGRRFGGAN